MTRSKEDDVARVDAANTYTHARVTENLMFILKISVGSGVVWSDTMKTYFDKIGQSTSRKEGRGGGVCECVYERETESVRERDIRTVDSYHYEYSINQAQPFYSPPVCDKVSVPQFPCRHCFPE